MKNQTILFKRTIEYLLLLLILLFSLLLKTGSILPTVQKAEAMGFFNVNSILDERDANLFDTVCLSTPSGFCTLRAAIDQAGYNNGPDTIILEENKTYKLTLNGVEDANASGDLDIHSDLTIEVANGGKATIDGNSSVLDDSVIQVYQGTVTLTGLVIQNGKRSGIQNGGNLTLRDVTVQNNVGPACNTLAFAGIANSGNLKMYRTTVTGNTGYEGGGIKNVGTFLAVNSTISGNSAFHSGGGIVNDDDGPGFPGTMTLRNTTVTNNLANICNIGGAGGGINNYSTSLPNLANTIVANNKRGLVFPVMDDCLGWFNSFGYNLIRSATGCWLDGTTAGNIFGADPLLGPLQNNGGLTATHALLEGSPAIDNGSIVGCKDELGFNLSSDQRGTNRHLDGGTGNARCDIGAYEYDAFMQPPPPDAAYTSFVPFVAR